MKKSKRLFLIFTAVFLGCVLTVGIVLGVISAVRSKDSVMKYKGVYLKEGVANYISASYKNEYINALIKSNISASDDESFWSSEAYDGVTYGDLLAKSTERYLMSVIIGSYLFDRNSRYTKEDKANVQRAIDEVLYYRADSSQVRFNEIGAEMGFTFEDFEKASVLLYKYQRAEDIIFGEEGESLTSGGFSAECNEFFLNNYSKVRVMLIRTDGEWETDKETGEPTFRGYSDVEKERILESIADIRAKISDGRMNEEAFIWHIENEYPTGTPNDTDGYYFANGSSYSLQFMEEGIDDGADEIVNLALSMGVGEYAECELEIGTCFIYKCELDGSAYSNSSLSRFFEDFYKLAKPYVYSKSVEVFFSDVSVKDRYNENYVITQPRNSLLRVTFD